MEVDAAIQRERAVKFDSTQARADLVKRNDKLDRDQAAKEQEMTKALEGQKKLKKRLEKAKQACAGLEKAVAQREDLVKEEDKRLQEVLDKARRFTKKLLDDEDYRPPNDEIKRFKNEDAVPSQRLHLISDFEPFRMTRSRRCDLHGSRRWRRAHTPSTRLVSIAR